MKDILNSLVSGVAPMKCILQEQIAASTKTLQKICYSLKRKGTAVPLSDLAYANSSA
jgi:hypothetical protein